VTAQTPKGCCRFIERLSEAIDRLAAGTQQTTEMHRAATNARAVGGAQSAFTRSSVETLRRCNHSDGHEVSLSADEALGIETCRECPCCATRLWISVPSVGAILDAVALKDANLPDLNVELTRREQQVLNVLHRSPYALRHEQLAALVWSEPDRTHDVRSVLYRLRRKLQTSGWVIPFPPKGQGVRLVRDATQHRQAGTESDRQEPDEASDICLGSAA
jgi:DNA-binding winged helix-turn-helix (wHTH) protein